MIAQLPCRRAKCRAVLSNLFLLPIILDFLQKERKLFLLFHNFLKNIKALGDED
jgi:hypothetical protein